MVAVAVVVAAVVVVTDGNILKTLRGTLNQTYWHFSSISGARA